MFPGPSETAIGRVRVLVSEPYRGMTVEQIADLFLSKLIHIADSAPPDLKAQAIEYRDSIRRLAVHYLKMAMQSERTTIAGRLAQAGREDISDIVRKL